MSKTRPPNSSSYYALVSEAFASVEAYAISANLASIPLLGVKSWNILGVAPSDSSDSGKWRFRGIPY